MASNGSAGKCRAFFLNRQGMLARPEPWGKAGTAGYHYPYIHKWLYTTFLIATRAADLAGPGSVAFRSFGILIYFCVYIYTIAMPTIFLLTGLIIVIVIVIVSVAVAVGDLDMGVCELSWRVGTSAVLGR